MSHSQLYSLAGFSKAQDKLRTNVGDSRLARWRADPVFYAEDQLKITSLTNDQQIALRSLLIAPYRVMMKAATTVGKTMAAGVAINWHYDSFDPSATITTAQSDREVKDVLWTEVRLQRMRAGLPDSFIGPAAPEMRTSPDHYAKGFTARTAHSFKGRHHKHMLFIFDEAVEITAPFWNIIKTMFKPELGHAWLVMFNPTNVNSRAHLEEHSGEFIDEHGNECRDDHPGAKWRSTWNVMSMSALNHPNVVQRKQIIENAVSWGQVNQNVKEWCEKLKPGDEPCATDFEWEGHWYRPGPEFESNVLGQWPSQSAAAIWSDSLWTASTRSLLAAEFPIDESPEIGVDLAVKGKDKTAIHARWGAYSILHEERRGLVGDRKIGRIIEVARDMSERVRKIQPKREVWERDIRIKVDEAIGGFDLVASLRDRGYNAIGINSAQVRGVNLLRYPKMRSQLWFQTVKKAEVGIVKLGLLPRYVLDDLKWQAMAPMWQTDGAGRRCVEDKEDTIERLGRSPDGMDAVNLAYLSFDFEAPTGIKVETPPLHHDWKPPEDNWDRRERPVRRRGIFGQGR